jgi:hypothetical protein
MLVLAERILKAYRGGGFVGAIVYGKQRLGKSSYASKVLFDIYQDWDVVLNHMLFDLRDVVSVMSRAVKEGKRIPAICWDDCGVHGNKMLYFANRPLVQYLQNLIDVIGINLGGLILTTPSPNNLLRVLRGYEFYRVKIFSDGGTRRHATGYINSLLPSGTRLVHREFTDYYDVMLPDKFWKPYQEKRQRYLAYALANLESLINTDENVNRVGGSQR